MPALTNCQEERLKIIKNGLNKQLKAIQIDKLALPAEQSKDVEFLHDELETQFNNYLDAVAQYLKAKNTFKETDVIGKIDAWTKTKLSLNQNLQILLKAKSREKGQEVFVSDTQGKIQVTLVESSKQKELQAQADQVRKQIERAESEIKQWTEKSRIFEKENEMIKTKAAVFKTNCLPIIGNACKIFDHHGDWRDFFNYLVSLVSAISDVFQSLHIKTTAEKILDTIEYNIDVAIKKAEHIDLHEAEYFGLIENPSFLGI
ncbi:TPA: hypothetical protein ACXYKD_000493 [Legionella anisa]